MLAEFWHTYPYLMASLLLAICAGLLLWLRPDQRRAMLLSGMLGTPFGLFSFEYIGHYWHPKVIAFFIASPEDLIFSFAVGVIAWALASWFVRRRLVIDVQPRTFWTRYLGYSALGIGIGYAIKLIHPIGVMNSTLISVAVVGLLLAYLRPDLRLLAVHGGIWFGAFYCVWLLLSAGLWPQFLKQWISEEMLSLSPFGLPVYEFIWALGYGLVWPLFSGHILNARLTSANAMVHSPSPRAHSSVD